MSGGAGRYLLAVSLEPLEASTTLFFGHLAERSPDSVRVIRYGHPEMAAAVAGATAIVLVRGLFECAPLIWCARLLNIPLYYFVDDNFIVLREQPGAWSPFIARYSADNVRQRLRVFQGVMLSTAALLEYFEAERLHERLMLFPPIEWRQVLAAAPPDHGGARIAFFGGRHLHDVLQRYVVPALHRLAAEQPVTLIAAGVDEPIAPAPGLTIVPQPYDQSYARGVRRLAEAGARVLVHPSVPELRNNQYKSPHAVITARAMGAVPVVSDRPPYDDPRLAGAALLSADTVDAWYAALTQALQPQRRHMIQQRLAAYCTSHAAGAVNQQVAAEVLARHDSSSRRSPVVGRMLIRACLTAARVARAGARAAKSVPAPVRLSGA
jgi:hypothetical protein